MRTVIATTEIPTDHFGAITFSVLKDEVDGLGAQYLIQIEEDGLHTHHSLIFAAGEGGLNSDMLTAIGNMFLEAAKLAKP